MAILSFFLLLVALATTTTTTLISANETPPPVLPPSQPIIPPQPPLSTAQQPPPTLPENQENQLNNIIDALIGAGDFAGWANLLSSADPSSLPITSTLFIPSNDAVSDIPSPSAATINIDPYLIPYHIVPQRLTFSDLQNLPIYTRLPTLLPSKYIVITNNSTLNLTINDSEITHPDIFVNGVCSVHGISNVLYYSNHRSPPSGNTESSPRETPTGDGPPKERRPIFPEERTFGMKSEAPCSCGDFLMVFWGVCAVHVFKILHAYILMNVVL